MAITEDMEMEVVDRLAAVGTAVDDNSIAICQPFGPSNLCRCEEKVPEQRRVITHGMGE